MKNLVSTFPGLLALAFASASASAVIPDPLPKAPEPVEDILRLQIFLDAQLFGPGQLDGRPGEFTTKALKRYQRAQGLPETEVESHTLDLASVPAELCDLHDPPRRPQIRGRFAQRALRAEQEKVSAL